MELQTNLTKTRSLLNLIDEEYSKALHTKSYVDMYSRIHNLSRSSTTISTTPKHEPEEKKKKKLLLDDHIPDFLFTTSTNSTFSHFHLHLKTLLLDFFNTMLQASAACASLLSYIDRARSHHHSIHRLLLNLSSPSSPSTFSELSSHLELNNPLSSQTLSHFHHLHSLYPTLIRRLTSAHRKISKKLKLVRFTKKASGIAIIVLLGAALVAAVVILSHGAAAVAAVPMVAASPRWFRERWSWLERARARVDAATKGAYIVGRDLDTMSQMLRRVHDEVEHGRDVARMVVRNRDWGMVREMVREMEGRRGKVGLGFEEQLEELEEHVYLCLVTINRSKRLVAEEMMEEQERHQ